MSGFSASYTLGLFFILCVSLIWAAASILVQYLYTEQSFDSPFLLTYIGVSLFTTLIPTKFALEQAKLLWERCLGNRTLAAVALEIASPSGSTDLGEYENVPSVPSDTLSQDEVKVDEEEQNEEENSDQGTIMEPPPRKWTNEDHVWAAMKIAPVWFIANWTYNASLQYTSITSSTVLASTGSLFTFLFAIWYRDEQFTCLKFMGVVLGVAGSLLTALHDASGSEDDGDAAFENGNVRLRLVRHLLAMPSVRDNDWWTQERALFGDALGLISAIGYGGYAVMVRVMCPRDESLMSMELLLGYIGLFNMVALSPILIYQLYGGNHSDLTWVVFGFLVIKGLLDNVLSDYLWARSVVLTSATVATVGLGLTIPLAFISDFLWMGQDSDQVVTFASVSGALAVLAGFVLVNVATEHGDGCDANQGCEEESSNQQPVELTEMNNYARHETPPRD